MPCPSLQSARSISVFLLPIRTNPSFRFRTVHYLLNHINPGKISKMASAEIERDILELFRSQRQGFMEQGRKYFSQVIQMIAICCAVDLSELDSLEKRDILKRSAPSSAISPQISSYVVWKCTLVHAIGTRCSPSYEKWRGRLARRQKGQAGDNGGNICFALQGIGSKMYGSQWTTKGWQSMNSLTRPRSKR